MFLIDINRTTPTTMMIVSEEREMGSGADADLSADAFDIGSTFSLWLQELQGGLQSESTVPNKETSEIDFESFGGSNGDVWPDNVLSFDDPFERVSSSEGILVLTSEMCLEADVNVEIALINGYVIGSITATERVVLQDGARVIGCIQTPDLWVKPGAVFDGDCVFIASEAPVPEDEELGEEQPSALAMGAAA